jgi:hypothetical protein
MIDKKPVTEQPLWKSRTVTSEDFVSQDSESEKEQDVPEEFRELFDYLDTYKDSSDSSVDSFPIKGENPYRGESTIVLRDRFIEEVEEIDPQNFLFDISFVNLARIGVSSIEATASFQVDPQHISLIGYHSFPFLYSQVFTLKNTEGATKRQIERTTNKFNSKRSLRFEGLEPGTYILNCFSVLQRQTKASAKSNSLDVNYSTQNHRFKIFYET